jgi:hypothetical protein
MLLASTAWALPEPSSTVEPSIVTVMVTSTVTHHLLPSPATGVGDSLEARQWDAPSPGWSEEAYAWTPLIATRMVTPEIAPVFISTATSTLIGNDTPSHYQASKLTGLAIDIIVVGSMLAAGILGTTLFAIRRWQRGKVNDVETTARGVEQEQMNTVDNVVEVVPRRVFATVEEKPRSYVPMN